MLGTWLGVGLAVAFDPTWAAWGQALDGTWGP